jgi:hypothetical protein
VSATGGAVAGSMISGSQIANHSIHRSKLAADAMPRVGPRGPQGYVGSVGPQGPQGAVGATGGFDPNKITYVAGQPLYVAPGGSDTTIVDCTSGQKVISGGFDIAGDLGSGFAYTSRPVTDTATGLPGWQIAVDNGYASGYAAGTPYAVCASA